MLIIEQILFPGCGMEAELPIAVDNGVSLSQCLVACGRLK